MPPENERHADDFPRQNVAARVDRGMHHASRKLLALIAAWQKKRLDEISEGDRNLFITDFLAFCSTDFHKKIERRVVKRWLDHPNSIIYQAHQLIILQFFMPRLPFLNQAMLLLSPDDFDVELRRAVFSVAQSLIIDFPVPLGVLTEDDSEFLCGIYELYRYSFANDGEINLDLLILSPDPDNRNRLKMQIIVDALRSDRKTERFVGYLYKYGRSLLGVPVFADEDPAHARVRRYEFSTETLTRTRENLVKIGIVSGNSVQLTCPVAARCLISKVSDSLEPLPEYLKIVNRYAANALYEPYVSAISNDIRRNPAQHSEQDDYLLIVKSLRTPKVRPRESFPTLPIDQNDPHLKRRSNR